MTTMGDKVQRREFLRRAGGLSFVPSLVGWRNLTAAFVRVAETSKMRNQAGPGLDKFDEREFDAWWKLQPYVKGN